MKNIEYKDLPPLTKKVIDKINKRTLKKYGFLFLVAAPLADEWLKIIKDEVFFVNKYIEELFPYMFSDE